MAVWLKLVDLTEASAKNTENSTNFMELVETGLEINEFQRIVEKGLEINEFSVQPLQKRFYPWRIFEKLNHFSWICLGTSFSHIKRLPSSSSIVSHLFHSKNHQP